ncbi:T9SS type A sorting domain-containing protein [uncultured Fluviicola sp.]|uniref:T9SS type A sorting domain-containing protein n=1 Tax=uncultured Fluviicola sp. TaxID=463303 RepID=UPI0025FED6E5|nr:T9SS type A sorting domain-containing protein [uncultured Fluviicola sp.]
MKNMLLFSFSVFSFLTLKAQTVSYQPIHGNYTQYVYRHQHWNGSENVESFSKTIWSGDTIINGQHYVRIFQDGVYSGGIREDVPNQQRFFINRNDVEINITIDHNLSVGALLTDSTAYLNAFRTYRDVNLPFPSFIDTLMVVTKDSVLESSGSYSVTYRMTDGGATGESVLFNTYSGLLEVNGFEYNYSQICYREDGEQTPPGQETPWTPMCDLGVDEKELLKIDLFPNPSSESLNISGDLERITDLAIYDLNGKMIKQVPLSDVYSGVSLKELKNGIYFLSVNEHQKVLRFQKM